MKMILRTKFCLERSCWILRRNSYYTEDGKLSINGQGMFESHCFGSIFGFGSKSINFVMSKAGGPALRDFSMAFNDLDNDSWFDAL